MPFSGTTYTNVTGATTAAAGQTVQSAVWNNIHTDLASALTQVMTQLVTMAGFKNILFANGSFDIWQRGAGGSSSFSLNASSTTYVSDRWYLQVGANQASTVAAVAALTNNSLFACKVTRNSGQTGVATNPTFGYPLDTSDIAKLLGNKCTLSFVAKAGANWSPASGTLLCVFDIGTAVPTKLINGYANLTNVILISTNLTPGGAAVAVVQQSAIVVPVQSTQAEVAFTWTPVGTAGADDSVTVDDVQLEVNGAATWTPSPYERIPFEISLDACKRHFASTFPYGTAPAQAAGNAGALQTYAISTTQKVATLWMYPADMRATPAITTFNPTVTSANWQDHTTSVSVVAVVDTSAQGTKGIFITASVTTSLASNDLLYIHAQADAGI